MLYDLRIIHFSKINHLCFAGFALASFVGFFKIIKIFWAGIINF
jgi:hypothetical protein